MADLLLTCGTSMRIFYSIFLGLDGIVYGLVDIVYNVFIVICNTQIFSATTFEAFSTRIYAILGIIMLFVVASQLLANIADPDKAASGEASTGKLVKNIIISLIAIVLLPTAFKYLYAIQKAVVSENIIGNIIVGGYQSSTSKDYASMIKNTGKDIAFNTFTAFINPAGYMGDNDGGCSNSAGLTYCIQYNKMNDYGSNNYGNVNLLQEKQIRNELDEGSVEYRWGLSTAAGIMVAYFLLSFSIDMGVRVVKLAYFQLIAPVPIILRIVPKKQDVFDNWLKSLMGTYLGLFIRLMVVYFCIFLINVIPAAWSNIKAAGGASDIPIVNSMVLILLIFGIFIFMKEAPKLISQMLGVSDGDMSIGIGKKLAGAAVVGGLVAKGMTAGKKYAGKAYGGLTGGLGGGWDAMMNGEKFGAGFRAGGLGGWDAGGRQFGKQRLESYKSRTGDYKGKPGMFGGKSFGTVYRGKTGDARDAAYAAASTARINAAKASAGTGYQKLEKSIENDIRDKYKKDSVFNAMTDQQQNSFVQAQASKEADGILSGLASNDVSVRTAADLSLLKYETRDGFDGGRESLAAAGKVIIQEADRQAKVEEEKNNKKAARIINNLGSGTPPAAPPAAPPAGDKK